MNVSLNPKSRSYEDRSCLLQNLLLHSPRSSFLLTKLSCWNAVGMMTMMRVTVKMLKEGWSRLMHPTGQTFVS